MITKYDLSIHFFIFFCQLAILINPLNAKIVAANFSCSAKFVFVKEKRWLCHSTEAPCNALVSVLRLYSNVYRQATSFRLVTYEV